MKKLLLLSLFLVLFSFGCGTKATSKDELLTVKDSGRIVPLESLTYDWKDINIEGGNVTHPFKFKNGGDDDLVLKTIQTSCMCTDAVITLADGTKSPSFGMHESPTWGGVVKTGEEFEVLITFDPLAHGPDAVGPIMRSIFLDTSSIAGGKDAKLDTASGKMVTEMILNADVLKKDEYEKKKNEFGYLTDESEFDFGIIKQSGGLVSHDFKFKYLGDAPLSVTGTPSSCVCTKGKISQKTINKGDEITLTVVFDPNLHEEPDGVFFKTVTVLTNPKLEKQPEFKIWAQIDLDLGANAYKLKEGHDDNAKLTK